LSSFPPTLSSSSSNPSQALHASEHQQNGIAATLVDGALAAVATLKAFNAAAHEHHAQGKVPGRMEEAAKTLNSVRGFTSGLNQFLMMGMFLQAF